MSHSAPRRPGVRIWPAGLAAAGYVGLTLALTYPLVVQFGRAIPGDGFDGWQNYWNLWWMKVALLEQHSSPLFTDLLYHPTGVGLLFHTLNPFNGLVTLPVQLAWGLLPAYNAVVIFSFAIGGLGACLLARHVLGPGASRLGAFIAGVVFTFSPFHVAHLLGHMQVISLEWIPFYALYLLRTVDRVLEARGGEGGPPAAGAKPAEAGRRGPMPAGSAGRARVIARDALLAALFLLLVSLCDWYYVLYCLLLTALVAVWAIHRALRSRRPVSASAGPRRPGALIGAVALSIAGIWTAWSAVMSPILIPMIREARQFRFMVPDPAQSRILSADLLAFVTPQEFHPLWGAWAQARAQVFAASVSEHQVFAGFTVLALAALGAWAGSRRRRSPAQEAGQAGGTGREAARIGLWLAALAVFVVLALGPALHVGGRADLLPGGAELPLPYAWLVGTVPFMEISRSVSRFDAMVMLALAVIAAAGADWLVRKGRAGRVAAAAGACLILFEFLPAPYPMSPPDTPAWYEALAADPRPGAVLNLPVNWDRPGYLLYQTVHEKPLTAAYISREDPRTLVERAPVLQHFRHLGPDVIEFDLAAQGRQVLADLGVRWVVLDRYKMPGGRERSYTEMAAGQVFAGQQPVYVDERLTVYEVAEAGEHAPYLVLDAGWEPLDRETRTRAFTGEAGLIIQAPAPAEATLRVVTAAGSGGLALAREGGGYAVRLALQRGANLFTLASSEPGGRVEVASLALEP